jgi:hypothetical protein
MSIRAITRAIVFVTCACATGVAVTACELLVQLDRSAVDAGEGGACTICSDVTVSDDGSPDGQPPSTDGSTDATARDAASEGSVADAATKD